MSNKWVYMFSEGDMTMRNLLGGKGANLAEMTSIGLPSAGLHYYYRGLYTVLRGRPQDQRRDHGSGYGRR